MATSFIEPGGDADFGTAFWSTNNGTVALATDIVHGNHIKSIRFRPAAINYMVKSNILADAGGRISFYLYIVALPTGSPRIIGGSEQASDGSNVIAIALTSGGVLQLVDNNLAQIGTNGSTLSTGVWYRICLTWTITSTTVNQIRLYKNAVTDISVSNATLANISSADFTLGISSDTTCDLRISDIYVDNSTALTDPGNIWVTAKRPNANGTTNGFTTQIGAGGSGYGTGHSPQVNERPLNNANGWSMVGAGSAITEEYTVEGSSVGDIDISKATLVDYVGWVDAKAALAETGSIIVGGTSSNISLTSTETIFTKAKGSTTYPAGGTDIGIITSTTLTTVSLYECGLIFAYIPAAASISELMLMGIGT